MLGDGEAIATHADHDAAQRQRGVVDARAEGALAPGCVDGQVRGVVGVLAPRVGQVAVVAAVRGERPVEQAQRAGRLERQLATAGRRLGGGVRQQRRRSQADEPRARRARAPR